ncbi:cytochrome b-c1 complex subunit Rieske-4 [Cucumis melo var. makuwa]|uniref:Cytochrome b-c1 complex subunit Rieske-4 n=1 Tax=Cucumis melo var. makuwa TaxID=1194695 RepID=A0A5A7VD25_CUCMM|nr:cytochrome b-c1 complex subunit Rieske-4 [Cucumis melo var. makuwa]TYJ99813.1 cytochrome b-c1 complex subunit Rieske-4 [Cucumis melo var. makuwa]
MLRIAARRLSSLSSSHFRPTIASSLPGSHNIIDSTDSNDFRSAMRGDAFFALLERKISFWIALAIAALSIFFFVDLLFDLF